MKKIVLSATVILGLIACGGFTEEQGKAADAMCECMAADAYGDFDINWFECDTELKATYKMEVFEEGSWVEALEEKCPDVADKLED